MAESTERPPAALAKPSWITLGDRLSGGNKAVRFALWGAFGCLVGAVLGEVLLAATRVTNPPRPVRAVCLLIDCSDSMRDGDERGSKLDEVKAAATEFVKRQDLSKDQIGVVGFASNSFVVASPGDNPQQLQAAISRLDYAGGTVLHLGLDSAALLLDSTKDSHRPVEKFILLFTDGQPNDAPLALNAADRCRLNNTKLVAIGTGDADNSFLAQLTGDSKSVFSARSGSFGDTFQKAEKAIYGGSLVESGPTESGFFRSLLQIIGWSALLATGGSIALIAGQNFYLRRRVFTFNELFVGLLGGISAGVVAGTVGQLFFALAVGEQDPSSAGSSFAVISTAVGRVLGWTMLGGIVGGGMAIFVPNLQLRLALLGGAIGGAVAALAFLIIATVGDLPGRLLGGAILGAFIGIMIAIFEAAFREYWLEVRLGSRETIKVTLGDNPVKIGSDSRACTIYARGARPLEVSYRLTDSTVQCVDYSTEKQSQVKPGDERVVGSLTVKVCGGDGPAAGQRPIHTTTRATASVVPPPPAKPGAPVGESAARHAPQGNTREVHGTRKVPPPPPAPPRKPND